MGRGGVCVNPFSLAEASASHTERLGVERREIGKAPLQSLSKLLPGSVRQFPLLKNGFNNSPLRPGAEGRLRR